jgi:hypothetical protein
MQIGTGRTKQGTAKDGGMFEPEGGSAHSVADR